MLATFKIFFKFNSILIPVNTLTTLPTVAFPPTLPQHSWPSFPALFFLFSMMLSTIKQVIKRRAQRG